MKTKGLIVSLLCLLAGAVSAGTVSVNWSQFTGLANLVNDPYGVELANNWHNISTGLSGTDLTDSDGTATTIDLAAVAPNGFATWTWGPLANTPMRTGMDVGNPGQEPVSFTLSDINATFGSYKIIVYVGGGNDPWNNGTGVVTDGTTTYVYTAPNPATTDLIQSSDTDASDGADVATYVVFGGLTADSVTITVSSEENTVGIGGFQIVGAPAGAANLISPSGIVNIDFDSYDFTWTPSADPNLVVNSFDLQYYSKDPGTVTANDPNFVANPGTTVPGVTSPYALSLDYDKVYFWRINSNVTWNGGGTDTVPSLPLTVQTEPSQVPPRVFIAPNGGRTWLGQAIDIPTTVESLDAFSYTWTVEGGPNNTYTGDPNLFLTGTTLTDNGGGIWQTTAQFTPSGTDPNILTGQYTIRLTAEDAVPSEGSDTMWVTAYETPCDVLDASGGYVLPFDDNFDCEITLDDFAAWAAVWLEDRSPSDPFIYLP